MTWDANMLKEYLDQLLVERNKVTDAITGRVDTLQTQWHHRFTDFERLAAERLTAKDEELEGVRAQLNKLAAKVYIGIGIALTVASVLPLLLHHLG